MPFQPAGCEAATATVIHLQIPLAGVTCKGGKGFVVQMSHRIFPLLGWFIVTGRHCCASSQEQMH